MPPPPRRATPALEGGLCATKIVPVAPLRQSTPVGAVGGRKIALRDAQTEKYILRMYFVCRAGDVEQENLAAAAAPV